MSSSLCGAKAMDVGMARRSSYHRGLPHPYPGAVSTEKQSTFIPVDEIVKSLGPEEIEQIPAMYGIDAAAFLWNATRTQARTACFLRCGKTVETSDRALSIDVGHPARQWHCFARGCGKGGNLVGLCDLA